MKLTSWAGLLALAVIAGGGVYAFTHREGQPTASAGPKSSAETAPVVSVVKASPADFVETVLVTGSVTARDETMIAPEIEGFRVKALSAEEGQQVSEGQLLATLTSDTLDAQLAQNTANIARSDAAIAVARSTIVQAEAAQKETNNAFERAKPLKQSGYLSDAAFDQRESAAATARSKLVAARDGLISAEADKAALVAQRADLVWKKSKAEIRSPVAGIISRRTARVGAAATSAGDPLFRIIARGELELDAEAAESDMSKIKEGQKTAIQIAGTGAVTGTVRLISSEVDRATRLGKVKVFLGTNPDLRLGAFGRGVIETARSRGIAVPTSSVVYGPEGAVVQVVSAGKVETRQVKTGLKTQTLVEVASGLADGETVVARSGSFLRNGDVVRPVFADTKVSGVTK